MTTPTTQKPSSARENLPPSEVLCRYFAAGYCARGDNCWYKHDIHGLKLTSLQLKTIKKPTADEEPLPQQGRPRREKDALHRKWERQISEAKALEAAKDSKGSSDEKKKVKKDVERILATQDKLGEPARNVAKAKEIRQVILVTDERDDELDITIPDKAEVCSICMEIPKEFGLMSSCDHVFCISCIKAWRSTSNSNKTCPMCRVRSQFIMHSSVFPYNPGAKNPQSSTSATTTTKACSSRRDAPRKGDKATVEEEGCQPGPSSKSESVTDEANSGSKNGGKKSPKQRRRHRKTLTASQRQIESNPAKARILENFLSKAKTIPCKYFCDPGKAKIVHVHPAGSEQSIIWGQAGSDRRKIPFCKFGNDCHYSHPHPVNLHEEYLYDAWEIKELDIEGGKRRRGKRPGGMLDIEDMTADMFVSSPWQRYSIDFWW